MISDSIATAVAQHLAAADVGEKRNAAVIAGTIGPDGKPRAQGVISAKLGEVWTVAGYFDVAKDEHVGAGVLVKATW